MPVSYTQTRNRMRELIFKSFYNYTYLSKKKTFINKHVMVKTMDAILIKKAIINRLVRNRNFGESYTHNIRNTLPKHLRGEEVTDEAIEEMLKDKWLIIPKHKGGEPMFSLNPAKVKEIMQFYEKHCAVD